MAALTEETTSPVLTHKVCDQLCHLCRACHRYGVASCSCVLCLGKENMLAADRELSGGVKGALAGVLVGPWHGLASSLCLKAGDHWVQRGWAFTALC